MYNLAFWGRELYIIMVGPPPPHSFNKFNFYSELEAKSCIRYVKTAPLMTKSEIEPNNPLTFCFSVVLRGTEPVLSIFFMVKVDQDIRMKRKMLRAVHRTTGP